MLARSEAATAEDPQARFEELLPGYIQRCRAEREEVLAAGGLYILGTERHESRRIDNQLRGRSGRQGDPGQSRFYLSLEDDLLRIFGSQRVAFVMDKLKIPEGEPIEHGMISKAIENAQRKVEAHNFDIRKHLIEYDDVMNKQREVVYTQRREVLAGEQLKDTYVSIVDETIEDMIASFCPDKTPAAEWDWDRLIEDFFNQFYFMPALEAVDRTKATRDALEKQLKDLAHQRLDEKTEEFTPEVMQQLMRVLLLQALDSQWKDHLLSIDHLKQGIGLRGYGQKNPKQEYKREAYALFMDMMGRIRQEVIQKIYRIQLARPQDVEQLEAQQRRRKIIMNRSDTEEQGKTPITRDEEKVGRNDPCPCGSGQKYKKCCGK
jgi:preprotein translocase subunit SecA